MLTAVVLMKLNGDASISTQRHKTEHVVAIALRTFPCRAKLLIGDSVHTAVIAAYVKIKYDILSARAKRCLSNERIENRAYSDIFSGITWHPPLRLTISLSMRQSPRQRRGRRGLVSLYLIYEVKTYLRFGSAVGKSCGDDKFWYSTRTEPRLWYILPAKMSSKR